MKTKLILIFVAVLPLLYACKPANHSATACIEIVNPKIDADMAENCPADRLSASEIDFSAYAVGFDKTLSSEQKARICKFAGTENIQSAINAMREIKWNLDTGNLEITFTSPDAELSRELAEMSAKNLNQFLIYAEVEKELQYLRSVQEKSKFYPEIAKSIDDELADMRKAYPYLIDGAAAVGDELTQDEQQKRSEIALKYNDRQRVKIINDYLSVEFAKRTENAIAKVKSIYGCDYAVLKEIKLSTSKICSIKESPVSVSAVSCTDANLSKQILKDSAEAYDPIREKVIEKIDLVNDFDRKFQPQRAKLISLREKIASMEKDYPFLSEGASASAVELTKENRCERSKIAAKYRSLRYEKILTEQLSDALETLLAQNLRELMEIQAIPSNQ